ncbi:MAG: hypothetical protein A2268_05810 [Candidatus Raymondbacteria bacterium RifOxyA12_full_50_37]|uniref:Uncharacterized protein n=1 Tax=Candidatus Raymondbacteria bacterium RIFOXYD12_FULL_49_13 TaxID=1817890 RepID=A0A1F7FG09_UNCRA|nr:MAG: hypothetical protein A2268_05810 [Candidatus Raymondbacteria bacterium RifOxyA12_full_50_37]OGJ94257.1 MAG: hypothetical protein A2248_14740 [Candidatus Raymondbacteria bacterium RIFOXYA2_FULL_49_16]OGJ94776.1 MAG: hypothetical protein A2487_01925 [Candidatus Raymondbacteria bacterium RifOxyC12_full_50_8]OGJ99087.1 MAG: hypothetical protein A2453_11150 [Candidatus Raymondbacteria bacterium RIFOXYC2_FULL_50_21]OGK01185.1 MAG: hypothetical protein A2350_01630 [Candidatus Raymondbacteria b
MFINTLVSGNKYERIRLIAAAKDKNRVKTNKNGAQEKTSHRPGGEEMMRGNLWQYRIINQ